MTQIKDLKANKRNPRKISDKKLQALRRSVEKFGDLSGFVYNRRTKQLISGHQRTKTIPENSTIKIEVKHDQPTAAMTVAEGYVVVGSERFKYREVDATPEWEMEALLAANKHGGEWDKGALKLAFADFPSLDLEMTGFDALELRDMGVEIAPIEIELATIDEILGPESEDDETDEKYISGQDETTEEIDRERLPNNTVYEKKDPVPPEEVKNIPSEEHNPFDEVEEQTEVKDKRIVIIIGCQSEEQKQQLREKLRPIITEAGASIF